MESQRSALSGWIRDYIGKNGPITVAQFIQWALYHPEHGYYTRGPNIGPRGDFTTSPEASPAFGQTLARHVVEVDAVLSSPRDFDLVEFGPGRGTLASNLLAELASTAPDLYSRIQYRLIEISPALVEVQRRVLLRDHVGHVRWSPSLALEHNLCGAIIANEFVDAFPVHVLEARGGVICEQYVNVERDALTITYGSPSSPELVNFLARNNLEMADGEKVEVNLAAGDWVKSAAAAFSRCVSLIADYGDVSPGRYSPRRREGTLLGYYRGTVTDDILAHPGEQDITALVDFTALQHDAIDAGFDLVGMTRQASLLIGLGLGTPGAQDDASDLDTLLRQRRGVQALVSMEGLGRFHVLLLSKGIDVDIARSSLSGLRYSGVL